MKAPVWRALMAIGMKFHHYASPKPPRPTFKIVIPSRLSTGGGTFKLVFYVPQSYLDEPDGYEFPVVVNFHGGGFTLGTGTDDARWAASVVNRAEAVFVSVEYRLAPEYPFSIGVEDGTDALLYLAAHADELRLDPHRIALSGFSAGGNFAFTVPLMLHDLRNGAGKRTLQASAKSSKTASLRSQKLPKREFANASTLSLPHSPYGKTTDTKSTSSLLKLSDLEPTQLEIAHKIPDITIVCIVSFYPPTDFRLSRVEKRATNPVPAKNLPPSLTTLFDESYLCTTQGVDMSDPYLSPACASDDFLRAAYPNDIVLYTCEHDMLNVEGVAFGERLAGSSINKHLHGGLIKGVVHAFDKKPNPIKFPQAADRCYAEACAELIRVFGGRTSVDEIRQLDQSYPVERFEAEVPGDKIIKHQDEEPDAGVQRRESSLGAFRTKWKFKDKEKPKNVSENVIIEEEATRGRETSEPSLLPPGNAA
ncbi:Alpha/Beta hydrolase protein [Calycina marina]|uniref:Alpha/Beta hydrolase protein n=1 Tax=Calycina marina TaxID=1763456 RepID=A0A9P7Z595_9HELO|nr:Alpha/Beta hydrolase protein [Calycina marina]